jgi:hypothetical protein
MFAMMFRTQWRWTRTTVFGIAALALVFPTLARFFSKSNGSVDPLVQVLDGYNMLGPLLGFLALLGPFVLAALPWTVDHEARHVYPLALPVEWSWWVGTRFAVGAITLLVPTLALYIGAVATVSALELPPLLRAYPGALALRFLLASMLSYSASFALQYLAGRRATHVAVTVLVALLGVSLVAMIFGQADLIERAGEALFVWPGPLALFVDPWTLIDV